MKDIHVIRAYARLRPYVEDHMPITAGHEGDGIGLSQITGN